MTLKDISHSGLLKLALLFIIIPRIASHIFHVVLQPFFTMINESSGLANNQHMETVESNSQQPELLTTTLTKEFTFIFTLVVGAYILTKIIEYLAQNTKFGDIKLGHKTNSVS